LSAIKKLLLATVLALVPQTALANGILPGVPIPSPTGTYVLRSVGFPNEDPANRLILDDKKTGVAIHVYSYRRGIWAAWASDERHFVLNDYFASDESDCVVFAIDDDHVAYTSLRPRLAAQVPKMKYFMTHGDNFLDAVGWLNSRVLVLKFYGSYGAPHLTSFEYWFNYNSQTGLFTASPHHRTS
jgi:hypothetical protein